MNLIRVTSLILLLAGAGCSSRSSGQERATVVNVAPLDSSGYPGEILIVARNADGLFGLKNSSAARFRCRVGSTINGSVHNGMLSIDPQVCYR